MTVTQISVFVENVPGALSAVTRILADAGVDLRAMSIADTTDYGILRFIADQPNKALEALEAHSCMVSVTPVLGVEIPDRPGGLAEVLGVLDEGGISLEYLYAFISRQSDHAYVILRVADNDATQALLAAHGISVAGPEELFRM